MSATSIIRNKAFRPTLKALQEWSEKFFVPSALKSNHRPVTNEYTDRMRDLIGGWGHTDPDEREEAVREQIDGHIEAIRGSVVPWLNSFLKLRDANVLEIGCGTGLASVAMAEQGARIVGVDIASRDLAIAAERLRLFELDQSVQLIQANATEIGTLFSPGAFDVIIFFGSLEHMTHEERMVALRAAWALLSPGQFLCVVHTPNRLWWFDSHTSFLPFFDWLPDDVAEAYIHNSPRYLMSEWANMPVEARCELQRWGRGISYHDFEIALGPVAVHSYMQKWLIRNPLHLAKYLMVDRSFQQFLAKKSGFDPAFCLPWLNFAVAR